MKVAVLAGLVSALIAASVAGATNQSAQAILPHSIVVTGDASVGATPDRAAVSFGVSDDAKTASAALRLDAADMTKVIAALKAQGIAAADIRTESVSLSARYNSNGNAVVGYTASNSVSAIIRDLAKTGPVIDAAVEAGANEVDGPNLSVGDTAALYRQALRAAIVNAKGKAETIAGVSGLHLIRITGVAEQSTAPAPFARNAPTAAAEPATPVEPGTQQVEATVTVTFSAE